MKSLIISLIILIITNLSSLSAQLSENTKPYNFDPTKTEELRVRDGLPNFFKKLKAGEDVKIGYIGGSITNGGLWRAKSLEWLKSEYPKANITQINAAIGGTGPDYGACRIDNHLLVHKPDMVFIEYRVNNGGAYKGRALEGLIPQIWKQNPNTEICIVYTISKGMIADIQKGNQTNAGKFMEPVANHYGITSIEFGLEVVKLLNDDKLVFQKGDAPAEGKVLFSKDGTHPLEAGHDIYRDVLVRSLKKIENHGTPEPNVIPAPSQKNIFSGASLVPITKAKFSSKWKNVDLGGDIHINDDLTDKNGGKKTLYESAKKSTTIGESFTLKWDGFMLGLTAKLEALGDIQLEVTTDGGKPKLFDLKSRNGKTQEKYIFMDELEVGSHTTTIKLVKLASGKEFQIGQFLVVNE
ncbi:SGNH/GDSL hydrolase family protein [Labilibacter marinus]|uniref:SGNH/GDSL hydrolase family protein n=1 Tax=Labilibacter marinus TaxID=1477105 RepID=UPI00082CB0E7|nr:SGNH/GDSL hydrolase family protein [Labilibacter marinus]